MDVISTTNDIPKLIVLKYYCCRSFNLLRKLVRDLDNFDMDKDETQKVLTEMDTKNVISVPNQCPAGYRPDALGICREIFDFRNTV